MMELKAKGIETYVVFTSAVLLESGGERQGRDNGTCRDNKNINRCQFHSAISRCMQGLCPTDR